MPYDQTLDTEIFKAVKEFGPSRITVAVYSYNNGPKKLQIVRENSNADGQWIYTKIGRMNKEEATEVIPIMMKAIENM